MLAGYGSKLVGRAYPGLVQQGHGIDQQVPVLRPDGQGRAQGEAGHDAQQIRPLQHLGAGQLRKAAVVADLDAHPADVRVQQADLIPRLDVVGFPVVQGVKQVHLGVPPQDLPLPVDPNRGIAHLARLRPLRDASGHQVDAELPGQAGHPHGIGAWDGLGLRQRLLRGTGQKVHALWQQDEVQVRHPPGRLPHQRLRPVQILPGVG